MAMIDPEQERRRLAERYAGQTNEQLEQVARQADELTEIAREALGAELAKRGMALEPSAPSVEPSIPDNQPEMDELEFRDLVTIRSFWNLLDAELAKGRLEASGIDCFLLDDNMVRMDWFNANALGGVKLQVDPENVEAANRVLEQAQDIEEEGVATEEEPELPS